MKNSFTTVPQSRWRRPGCVTARARAEKNIDHQCAEIAEIDS